MDTETVVAGVAFHHGGLDVKDRRMIEQSYLEGNISVICCTSTLAVGVNLPCHLVIIKGTVGWTERGSVQYSDMEVMQMLGRAGRPQFEDSAKAVILTRPEKASHYEKMISGEQLLESCLHLNLLEHLNAEIGLGSIFDLCSAKKWLAGTFLHVRFRRNPEHYRLDDNFSTSTDDDLLRQICEKDIGLLKEAELIEGLDRFKSTEFGNAMARCCVKFETMKLFLALPPKAKVSEIVRCPHSDLWTSLLICLSASWTWLPKRQNSERFA